MNKVMNILICNDDGINAPGILALARELKKLGRVVVCAPESQRSAAGHSFTLHTSFKVQKRILDNDIEAYAIWGTPKDCIELGIVGIMKRDVDLIVTGINEGPNCGTDMVCSGTIGCASSGLNYHIPAIAVSLDRGESYDYSYAAKIALECAKWFIDQPFNRQFVLNVNVPNINEEEIKGVAITGFGGMHDYGVDYHMIDHGDYMMYEPYENGLTTFYTSHSLESDLYAIANGYISISPLDVDVVKYESLSNLQYLKKTLEKKESE